MGSFPQKWLLYNHIKVTFMNNYKLIKVSFFFHFIQKFHPWVLKNFEHDIVLHICERWFIYFHNVWYRLKRATSCCFPPLSLVANRREIEQLDFIVWHVALRACSTHLSFQRKLKFLRYLEITDSIKMVSRGSLALYSSEKTSHPMSPLWCGIIFTLILSNISGSSY